jgi:hypothetical protein
MIDDAHLIGFGVTHADGNIVMIEHELAVNSMPENGRDSKLEMVLCNSTLHSGPRLFEQFASRL